MYIVLTIFYHYYIININIKGNSIPVYGALALLDLQQKIKVIYKIVLRTHFLEFVVQVNT